MNNNFSTSSTFHQTAVKRDSFVKKAFNNPLKKFSKKHLTIAGLLLVLVAAAYFGRELLTRFTSGTNSEGTEVAGAKAMQNINKELSFPIKDGNEEVGRIKYVVESAELRDEIIVQGQKAKAVKDRTFLIVTLKITNEHRQAIEIETKDYIRLSVNGKDEWLAPDIHNDPVDVQAISTKYTRIGFPINNSDKDITLRIGEINEDAKEEVKIDF